MKLLTAEEVKSSKETEKKKQEERTRRLNEEESSSARKLNEAKERERLELEAIEKSIAGARADAYAKIQALTIEVSALEQRRQDALKPTIEREKNVEAREHEIVARNKAFNDALLGIEDERRKAREMKEHYQERYNRLDEWNTDLSKREEKIVRDREEVEAYSNNAKRLIRDEQERLRKYFEAEDAKLNLIRKQNQHG